MTQKLTLATLAAVFAILSSGCDAPDAADEPAIPNENPPTSTGGETRTDELKKEVGDVVDKTGEFMKDAVEASKPVVAKGAELVEDAARAVGEKAGDVAEDLRREAPPENTTSPAEPNDPSPER